MQAKFETKIKSVYVHNKTLVEYAVLQIASHTETKELLIIYTDGTNIWARPKSMFEDGRFSFVKPPRLQMSERINWKQVSGDLETSFLGSGYLFSWEQYSFEVNTNYLIDYDGYGKPLRKNNEGYDAYDRNYCPSELQKMSDLKPTHVYWYNRC